MISQLQTSHDFLVVSKNDSRGFVGL